MIDKGLTLISIIMTNSVDGLKWRKTDYILAFTLKPFLCYGNSQAYRYIALMGERKIGVGTNPTLSLPLE